MNEIMKIRNLSKIYGKKEVRTTAVSYTHLGWEQCRFNTGSQCPADPAEFTG